MMCVFSSHVVYTTLVVGGFVFTQLCVYFLGVFIDYGLILRLFIVRCFSCDNSLSLNWFSIS